MEFYKWLMMVYPIYIGIYNKNSIISTLRSAISGK